MIAILGRVISALRRKPADPRQPEKFSYAAGRVGMTFQEREILENLETIRQNRPRNIAMTLAQGLELSRGEVVDTVDRLLSARVLVKRKGRYVTNQNSYEWKILRAEAEE